MSNSERIGSVIILSGPSGAGKSTVCNQIIAKDNALSFSVSCTTRKPREGEINGVNYHFLAVDDFKAKIEADDFLEWAEVHGNYYGTQKSEVLGKAQQGYDVLLDIDVQGARLIREHCANDAELTACAEFVFVAPPSFEELESRLRGRGTEDEATIQKRLGNAKGEMEAWKEYDYLLIFSTPDESVNQLKSLLTTLRNKTSRLKEPGFNA